MPEQPVRDELDQGVAFGPSSQASPEAGRPSSPSVSIPNAEICTIRVIVREDHDRELGFSAEDVVKNAWMQMIPWFTNRRGISQGSISLESGLIVIEWAYSYPGADNG